MKKNVLFTLGLIIMTSITLHSQNIEKPPVTKKKADQSKLYNEVYAGYGLGTLYLFTGTVNHSYPAYDNDYNSTTTDVSSPGAFLLGFNRMINRVVMVGFEMSYMNLSYSRTSYPYDYQTGYIGTVNYNDNLLSGMAKVTFNYVNKPMVRVYSGFGMGITVDLSNAQGTKAGDVEETAKKILPSGQLTFMGVRFGRAFGGFCEFGIGTNAIVSAGLSYQFGD
jgi:opacity protein-like surface antigen